MLANGLAVFDKGFTVIDSLIANVLWGAMALSILAHLLKIEHSQRLLQQHRISQQVAEELQEFLAFSPAAVLTITQRLSQFHPHRVCQNTHNRKALDADHLLTHHICQLIPLSYRRHLSFELKSQDSNPPFVEIRLTAYSTNAVSSTHATPSTGRQEIDRFTLVGILRGDDRNTALKPFNSNVTPLNNEVTPTATHNLFSSQVMAESNHWITP